MGKIINPEMLKRFRGMGRCEWCREWTWARHAHHLWTRGQESCQHIDLPINLIALCWRCHLVEIPAGRLTRDMLLTRVGLREGRLPNDIEREMFLLLRTPTRELDTAINDMEKE